MTPSASVRENNHVDASQSTEDTPSICGPLSGAATSTDPQEAVGRLYEEIHRANNVLSVIFCSTEFNLKAMEQALASTFGTAPLIGCTSAGEITPQGYRHGTLTGFSLPAEGFSAVNVRIDNLSNFEISNGHQVVKNLIARLDAKHPPSGLKDTFAFLMIDGLSCSEEPIVSSLYSALDDIPLFGGSAGDGLNFNRTFVYHEGAFHTNSAILTLVRTDHPFKVFKTQHFISSDKKMVVTEADPKTRIVSEINAEPAAREYARLVGLAEEELTPMIFATYPVVVKVGGTEHVRSIQKVNEDGSLTFFCAIDKGVVLTVAKGVDIIENLEDVLTDIHGEIGEPQFILGCDCVLRSLELERKQLKHKVGKILSDNNTIGFNTYGEQFQAMHVNQTFTGVAIGRKFETEEEA